MKNKLKVYISAPVTDHDIKERKRSFAFWSKVLGCLGCEPVNPLEAVPDDAPTSGEGHESYMKSDLKMLLDCDAIVMFEDWRSSVGCTREARVAAGCGIRFIDPRPLLSTGKILFINDILI